MFDQLKLAPVLLENCRRLGYVRPMPVQASSIPPALAGLDVVATAETGSGKTAAFLLPVMHRLMTTRSRGIRALVLCPTREIALQTECEARKLGQRTGLRSTAIYGGVGYQPQEQALQRGVDIVVATPGRLLDYLGRRTFDLKGLVVLVLDEADRMLDMGFMPDIRRILDYVPAARQTLLYSATMPPEILELSRRLMKEPVRVAVGDLAMPPSAIQQAVWRTSHDDKTRTLIQVLRSANVESALVFTRTKHRADRLAHQLVRAGVGAACIHGNRSQRQREAALDGFRKGSFRVLVATDIAARGLDIQGITHVINYDLPPVADDYVHRIGRTARAGAPGYALSLVTEADAAALRGIEKALGYRIRTVNVAAGGAVAGL
jgi:ATP-dependent RNA helicase RhlE